LQDRSLKALALQTAGHEHDQFGEEKELAADRETHTEGAPGNEAPGGGAEVLLYRHGVEIQPNLPAKADDDFGR